MFSFYVLVVLLDAGLFLGGKSFSPVRRLSSIVLKIFKMEVG